MGQALLLGLHANDVQAGGAVVPVHSPNNVRKEHGMLPHAAK